VCQPPTILQATCIHNFFCWLQIAYQIIFKIIIKGPISIWIVPLGAREIIENVVHFYAHWMVLMNLNLPSWYTSKFIDVLMLFDLIAKLLDLLLESIKEFGWATLWILLCIDLSLCQNLTFMTMSNMTINHF
jgi:hypothetical protein